ncbi:radical SAM family heme chaperone HemW [Kineosporia rhizophila]|uniref:radical SAM family heme chaperone HemW n=1 Tax=Kineosporia rhizophila TaxID=84633 RepID=UPI001E32D2BC|nr:radical SAM family heme chaperone HemW [Kineosporia rhizophila]MCE0539152.1 radical SAM family heme chaperone HemW [Kineosporia rhizophila]
MAGPPPDGEPAPLDGALPASAAVGAAERAFGVYLHVPFCAVRCGYCDFNTYTAKELGGGASQAAYAGTAVQELSFASSVLSRAGVAERPVSTVFVGGGTPTLLPASDLALLISGVRDNFGLVPGAEVTVEANPDSVTPDSLAALAQAGVTRVSFGMQSQVRHVLAVLDRTHDPKRIPDVVRWARDVGLSVSLDLIYGTPGESLSDWRASLEAALACEPDHLSAYALVVEAGTRLAARVRRGEVKAPDDDDEADKYELADELISAAGLTWYEVSNWARTPADACQHNLAYWRGDDWWGVGPGAHSHVGGVRWWNVRHPTAYAARIEAGESPAQGREVLDAQARQLEEVLLRSRLREGLPLKEAGLHGDPGIVLAEVLADGLVEPEPAGQGTVVLTRRGRLLADAVVRALLP